MARENLLSVPDIARELNTGKATIKFLLKRFNKWLPHEAADGQAFYPPGTIQKLFLIQENLESGIVPSEIEKNLETLSSSGSQDILTQFSSDANQDIRLSRDGLGLLRSLFQDIGEQQKRIAAAHEKRAEAEERKAAAIEKRAGAEEKKAHAMNNIAAALQEMNQLRGNDPGTRQIALEAASVIATSESDPLESDSDESDPIESDLDEIETDLSSLLDEDDPMDGLSGFDNLSDLLGQGRIDDSEPDDLDDLTSLLDTPVPAADAPDDDDIPGEDDPMDDLSALIDAPKTEPEEPGSDDPDSPNGLDDLDDLSLLVDSPPEDEVPAHQGAHEQDPALDNLSELIKPVDMGGTAPEAPPLDDLSALIDGPASEPKATESSDLDDLSALVDDVSEPAPTLDDLSALVGNASVPDRAGNDMDDLSALVDQASGPDSAMDDLSTLVDQASTTAETSSDEHGGDAKDAPVLKIDISPEQDLEKYKAAVMKIIIQLKSDGLSVEETTGRLNRDKVRTLSGKPEWNQRTLSQIYRFIDSAS